MVVTKEHAWNEPVSWAMDCHKDSSAVIFLEDITIDNNEDRPIIVPNENAEGVFEKKPDEFLTTYLYVTSDAMQSLLSGKDEHFKLERVAITDNNEVKLYFDRKQLMYYSWRVRKSLHPCFTVVFVKNGYIQKKARIAFNDKRWTVSTMLYC